LLAKTLWRFLDFAQLQLHPETPLPPPPRQHDGLIMEDALLANLPHPTILAINHCCIAHQAIYWSDVANGWGNSISLGMLCLPTGNCHSTWTWPPEVPSCSDWLIWATFLKVSTFAELLVTNDNGTKDQQKQVDGPQLQLGTEWRLRHA